MVNARKYSAPLLLIVILVFNLNCAGSDFSAKTGGKKDEGKQKPATHKDQIVPGVEPTKEPNPHTPPKGCLETLLPLQVMIVLDVSYSMRDGMETIKKNIHQFVPKLKAIKPQGTDQSIKDVAIGLLAFEDDPKTRKIFPLASDSDFLNSGIAKLQPILNPQNNDGPEEGLSAVSAALDYLESNSTYPNAINIVLLISDNYSHNGGYSYARNYQLDFLVNKMKTKSFPHLFLYDAAPTKPFEGESWLSDRENLPPQKNPAAQWQDLRKKVNDVKNSPEKKRMDKVWDFRSQQECF